MYLIATETSLMIGTDSPSRHYQLGQVRELQLGSARPQSVVPHILRI